jgi:hypothetical protein
VKFYKHIMIYIYHYTVIHNMFFCSIISLCSAYSWVPSLYPLATIYLIISIILLFPAYHIVRTTVCFLYILASLISNMHLHFVYVFSWFGHFFFILWYHILFTYWRKTWLPIILTIVNKFVIILPSAKTH